MDVRSIYYTIDTAQEADPVRGVIGAHGVHETAEVRDVRGTREGCGFREVTRNLMDGVSWATSEFSASTPTSGRSQPGTRGNNIGRRNKGPYFHDEMDRGRERQGSTTACSNISERDGKDQGEGSSKQACSHWFARHS